MAELDELLAEVEARPVSGWDFSWLGARVVHEPLPWDFEEIVFRRARRSSDLLDMGTGGGERLARMPYRPPRTVATEAWEPNIDVAGRRLRPLGVTVVRDEGAPDNVDQRPDEERGRLPFPSESFELVTNRHEAFVAREVARILVPRGTFVTQQVRGDYGDFHDALGLPRPRASRWTLDLARAQVVAAGLEVVAGGEAHETTEFADVGAFAWYLKAIPWIVAGFSTSAQRPALERLHERMPLRVRQPAFWLQATKPR